MALEKRRNIRITCCECCFHLIIVFILAIGYSLSDIDKYNEAKYSDLSIRIPPLGLDDGKIRQGALLRLYNEIIDGPLIVPSLDQYIQLKWLFESDQYGELNGVISETAFGRSFTNLLYSGDLHFAPHGALVDSLISYMNSSFNSDGEFDSIDVYVHSSEQAGVDFIMKYLERPAFALIVLRDVTPSKVNYVIRQNYTTLPNTNEIRFRSSVGLDRAYQDYILSGFLSLQQAVDDWAFNYTRASSSVTSDGSEGEGVGQGMPQECSSSPPRAVLTPYPTYAYDNNEFYAQVGFLLGLAMAMATIYPLSRLVKVGYKRLLCVCPH